MGSANVGDFETGRSYPLDLVTLATEIPGYEGCSTIKQAEYNALPLGAQFVIRTGIATIPAGAAFRKTSQTLYGSGGRITRVVNPMVDTITVGSAVDSFIANLTTDVSVANRLIVSGTLRRGNGAINTSGIVKVSIRGAGGDTTIITEADVLSAEEAYVFSAGTNGCGAIFSCQATTEGAFSVRFQFHPGLTSFLATIPVVVEYCGLSVLIMTVVDIED